METTIGSLLRKEDENCGTIILKGLNLIESSLYDQQEGNEISTDYFVKRGVIKLQIRNSWTYFSVCVETNCF